MVCVDIYGIAPTRHGHGPRSVRLDSRRGALPLPCRCPYPAAALTLSLLVTWIGTNDVDPSFSLDDFTIFTNAFHAGADFHRPDSFGWSAKTS